MYYCQKIWRFYTICQLTFLSRTIKTFSSDLLFSHGWRIQSAHGCVFPIYYIFSKKYLIKVVYLHDVLTESLLSLTTIHKHITWLQQIYHDYNYAQMLSGLHKSQLTGSHCAWRLGPVPTESPPPLREPRRGQPLSEAQSPGGDTPPPTSSSPPSQQVGIYIYDIL